MTRERFFDLEVNAEDDTPRYLYVGPRDGRYGPLQIVREGTERTLCDLPLQPHWGEHSDAAGRVVCRGCAAIAGRLK